MAQPLRICVFGAGAIGGHLAVRLATARAQVSVIARGANLAAIRERGLTLRAHEKEPVSVRVEASDAPQDFGIQDIVIVTVKLAALPAALKAAAPLIGADTRVVFVMNGMPWWFANRIDALSSLDLAPLLDPTGELGASLPERQWAACAITSGNRVVEPGVILNTSRRNNRLYFGFSDGRVDPVLTQLEAMLVETGMVAAQVPDIRQAIWQKLLINCSMSAISAISERDIRQTCEDADARRIVMATMQEIIDIGKAIGVAVDSDPFELTDPAAQPAHITSFLQDLRAGRPLEISNGILAVRAIGTATGMPIPHLDTVATLLAARSPSALSAAQE